MKLGNRISPVPFPVDSMRHRPPPCLGGLLIVRRPTVGRATAQDEIAIWVPCHTKPVPGEGEAGRLEEDAARFAAGVVYGWELGVDGHAPHQVFKGMKPFGDEICPLRV
ncbi:hypothetical protein PG984_006470 [Apiospora sp. TS-2023a]